MPWLQNNRIAAHVVRRDVDAETSQTKSPKFASEKDQMLVEAAQPALPTAIKGLAFAVGVTLRRSWLVTSLAMLVMLHSACGVCLVFAGYLHFYLTNSRMAFVSGLTADQNPWHFKRAAIVYITIGSLHLARVAYILLALIRNCTSVLRQKKSKLQRLQSVWRSTWQRATKSAVVDKFRNQALQALQQWGLLDSQGGFMKIFTMQEVVVVLSQTYQAYRCCNLISRPWITSLYVTLVVSNCWIIPALCIYLRNQPPALIRSVILIVDALLNIGSCFVFPLIIFWPYYYSFDTTTSRFPVSKSYDQIWQSRLITEIHVFFALSLPDLLSKMLNHFSVFASLTGATAHLQQQLRRSTVGSFVVKMSNFEVGNCSIQTKTPHWIRLLQIFIVVWGVGLLSIYVHALNHTRKPLLGCKVMAHPWFSTGYPCSVFEFNCFQRKVQSPTGSDIALLNPRTLQFLSFTHCPDVIVPTEIQDFPYLLGFHLHNCTIAEWSAASSISATKHTRMTAVAVTRCNMTSFPEGLTQALPARLYAMAFSITNITTLPANIIEHWKSVSEFTFEHSALQEVPENFFQLNAAVFSFAGNDIRRLPSFDAIHRVIPVLDVSDNPLQALPATLGAGTYIQLLIIQDTNISIIPEWFTSSLGQAVADGSPYCALPVEQQSAPSTSCLQSAKQLINMSMLDAAMPLDEN